MPAHTAAASARISEVDRLGNDQADNLARLKAVEIGPSPAQVKRYSDRLELCKLIQRTHASVLDAVQRAEGAAQQPGGRRRRRDLVVNDPQPGRARGRPPPILAPGELRTWGPHLVRAGPSEGFVCISCKRQAKGACSKRAMSKLPCLDRRGLTKAGMTQPQWERWNNAWILRWSAEEAPHGVHQLCRYYTTSWDGRFLCLKCGLHYVRRTEMTRAQCHGAPQNRKAQLALEAADRGDPLPRRAVSSRAAHPSGANLRAAGPRHPAHEDDRIRHEPRPPGPRAPAPAPPQVDEDTGSQPVHLGPLSAFGFRIATPAQPSAGVVAGGSGRAQSAPALARPCRGRVFFRAVPSGAQSSTLATALGATVRPGNPPRPSSAPPVDQGAPGPSAPAPPRPQPESRGDLLQLFQRRPLEPD